MQFILGISEWRIYIECRPTECGKLTHGERDVTDDKDDDKVNDFTCEFCNQSLFAVKLKLFISITF